MKRHEILQPFSRDHNVGLVLARALSNTPQDSIHELIHIWDDEMRDHFEEEEALLGPLAPAELRSKLVADHEEIRELVERARRNDLAELELRQLGEKLDAHIRWEERVLFPAVEASPNLGSISEATQALERRRHDSVHSPRRGELMDRHPGDGEA